MILRPFFIAMRMIKRCPTDIFLVDFYNNIN